MPEQAQPRVTTRLQQLFGSWWTFATLQVLDLMTTLAVFHAGAFEANPLVAWLISHFGRVGGVLVSKLIPVLIAVRVKRLIWVANLFYVGVVCWNIVNLIALLLKSNLP
jgi:hypothetical protein